MPLVWSISAKGLFRATFSTLILPDFGQKSRILVLAFTRTTSHREGDHCAFICSTAALILSQNKCINRY